MRVWLLLKSLSSFLHMLRRIASQRTCRCNEMRAIMLETNRGPRWNQKTQLGIVMLEFRLSRIQINLPPQGEPEGIKARRELRFFIPVLDFAHNVFKGFAAHSLKGRIPTVRNRVAFFIPSRAAIPQFHGIASSVARCTCACLKHSLFDLCKSFPPSSDYSCLARSSTVAYAGVFLSLILVMRLCSRVPSCSSSRPLPWDARPADFVLCLILVVRLCSRVPFCSSSRPLPRDARPAYPKHAYLWPVKIDKEVQSSHSALSTNSLSLRCISVCQKEGAHLFSHP